MKSAVAAFTDSDVLVRRSGVAQNEDPLLERRAFACRARHAGCRERGGVEDGSLIGVGRAVPERYAVRQTRRPVVAGRLLIVGRRLLAVGSASGGAGK